MLIKSLSLKDFKCFEQVDIDFGKITLLTGANSSGKSSLIYALLGIMPLIFNKLSIFRKHTQKG
jgi:predicted ATPase